MTLWLVTTIVPAYADIHIDTCETARDKDEPAFLGVRCKYHFKVASSDLMARAAFSMPEFHQTHFRRTIPRFNLVLASVIIADWSARVVDSGKEVSPECPGHWSLADSGQSDPIPGESDEQFALKYTDLPSAAFLKVADTDEPLSEEDISALLSNGEADGQIHVIVELRLSSPFIPEGHLGSDTSIARQRNTIAEATDALLDDLTNYSVRVYRRWASLPYIALEVDTAGLRHLANSSLVRSIRRDRASVPHGTAGSD